ncbi:MAG: response regulator [Bdellovibrionales bacterium]|nr:response regulator [Bdellovibrionales bacterium]
MSRVLVIDDSDYVRNFMKDVLTDAGFEVVEAENGTQGLLRFEQSNPDCVLLDVLMPDIDGLEVLKRIRATALKIPVLLMTGDDPGWARRTCESYGATGFLSKTLYADKLVETVEEVILDSES